MDNILDNSDKEEKSVNRFSKLSFTFSIIEVLLVLYLFMRMPSRIKASEAFADSSFISITILLVIILVGVVLTTLGVLKKEKATWIKWVGAIINFLLFFIVLSLLLLAGI